MQGQEGKKKKERKERKKKKKERKENQTKPSHEVPQNQTDELELALNGKRPLATDGPLQNAAR
uniref:Uncharacterized protein n=1 Tax=Mustela putorius furo TaxID=9669 RepID=M3YHT3_MUSPF